MQISESLVSTFHFFQTFAVFFSESLVSNFYFFQTLKVFFAESLVFNFFGVFVFSMQPRCKMHCSKSLTQSAISSLKTTLQVQKNCTKKFTKNHLASPVSFSLLNKTPRQGVNSLLDANVALIVVAGGELAKTGRKKGDFWASFQI